MVHNKIVILAFLTNLIFISSKCDNKKADYERQIPRIEECLEELESSINLNTILFCSNEIINKSFDNKYYIFKSIDCLEMYLKNEPTSKYYREIRDFISYSDDCSAYICERKNKRYIIVVGKATGRSGIGHLYWNYLYTDLIEDIKYRSSLVNNPFSFQLVDNKVRFIEINDNFSLEDYEENDSLDLFILNYLDDFIEKKENFSCKNIK